MKNKTTKNGRQGAEHSSTTTSRHSHYCNAISKYLHYEELAGPVDVTKDSINYTFDYVHLETGKLFKIIQGNDLAEYDKYTDYRGKALVIVDLSSVEDQVVWSRNDRGEIIILEEEFAVQLLASNSLFYLDGRLFEYCWGFEDGRSSWSVLDPRVHEHLEEFTVTINAHKTAI